MIRYLCRVCLRLTIPTILRLFHRNVSGRNCLWHKSVKKCDGLISLLRICVHFRTLKDTFGSFKVLEGCQRLGGYTELYQNIGIFEIVSPIGSDLPLSANVPDVEFESWWLNRFDIESLRWCYVGDIFVSQVLQQRRFAGVVQTQ